MVPPTSRVGLLYSVSLIQKLPHTCTCDSRPCQNDSKHHTPTLPDGTVPKAIRASTAVGQPEKATFKLALEDRQEFDWQSREGKDSEQRDPCMQGTKARNVEEHGGVERRMNRV